MKKYQAFITTDKFVTAIYEGCFTKKATIRKAIKWANQVAKLEHFGDIEIRQIDLYVNHTGKIQPCFALDIAETITF